MTLTVVPHTIGGDAEEGPDGKRQTAVFLVHGLETAPSRYLWQALDSSGVPRYSDPHPTEPGLFVYRKRARVGGTGDKYDLRIDVKYGPASLLTAGGATVGRVRRSLRSDLVTEETTRDVFGNLMQTRYVTALSFGLGGSSITIEDRVHQISVQRAAVSVVTQQVEPEFPVEFSIRYGGTVNASTYRGRGQDQWLLNISADDRDDDMYDVTYTVTLLKTGWQATIYHTENGIIPLNTRLGNGIEIKQVYERVNFSKVPL